MTSHKQLKKYILEHRIVYKGGEMLAIDYFKDMLSEGKFTFDELIDRYEMLWPIEYQRLVRNIYKEECKAALQ